jgi:WD40 repeat protein
VVEALPEAQGVRLQEGRGGWRSRGLAVDEERGLVALGLEKLDLSAAPAEDALSLWSLEEKRRLRVFPTYADGVDALAFSPTEDLLLVGGASKGEGHLGLWRVEEEAPLRQMAGFPAFSTLQTVVFSHDGKRIFLGGGQQRKHAMLVMYDKESASVTHTFDKLDAPVRQVALSYDDSLLLVRLQASSQMGKEPPFLQSFRVWDLVGMRLRSFGQRALPCRIRDLSFLPEGTVAALAMEGIQALDKRTSARVGWVELWDVRANKQIMALERPHADFLVHSVAVSPDGRFLLTGSGDISPEGTPRDTSLRLWDLHAREVVREMKGHQAPISHVAFSPRTKTLISADERGELRIWPW